jgi:hypothetical protein
MRYQAIPKLSSFFCPRGGADLELREEKTVWLGGTVPNAFLSKKSLDNQTGLGLIYSAK